MVSIFYGYFYLKFHILYVWKYSLYLLILVLNKILKRCLFYLSNDFYLLMQILIGSVVKLIKIKLFIFKRNGTWACNLIGGKICQIFWIFCQVELIRLKKLIRIRLTLIRDRSSKKEIISDIQWIRNSAKMSNIFFSV